MNAIKLFMLFHLYVVTCVVLILHYNGLLRSTSASRFDQSLIKRSWKWHTFIEVRLKLIPIPYQNEFSYLVDLTNQKNTNTDNLGFSLRGCSYYENITSKYLQFY